MGKPKYSAKTDLNQAEIVRQLNDIPGVWAIVIEEPVDILVGYRARNFLFEIKQEHKRDWQSARTQKQKDFLKKWPGQVRVASTFEEIWEVMQRAYRGHQPTK